MRCRALGGGAALAERSRMRRVILASLILAYATACTIYLGDDDPVPCEGDVIAPLRLVNPNNLACEDFSSGCDGTCGPCTLETDEPIPSWAACDTACTGLDELTCIGTAGCRAAHDWGCYTGDGPCAAEVSYLGCFGVDGTGPVQGRCAALDAWECSMHDDCIALHDTYAAEGGFVECVPEMR